MRRIEEGARCTWFYPSATPSTVRKQWIAGTLKPAGEFYVDAGAAAALTRGKSLLPAGVTALSGQFERGDAVIVRMRRAEEIARGLSAYSSADAERLRGRKSTEIAALLGFHGRDEIIHRDDLVVTAAERAQMSCTARRDVTLLRMRFRAGGRDSADRMQDLQAAPRPPVARSPPMRTQLRAAAGGGGLCCSACHDRARDADGWSCTRSK